MHVVLQEYESTDAAGLLNNAPKIIHVCNRVLDEDFFEYITKEYISMNIHQIYNYFSWSSKIRLTEKKIEHLGCFQSCSSHLNTPSSVHDSAKSCLKEGSKYCTTEIIKLTILNVYLSKTVLNFYLESPGRKLLYTNT